MQGDPLGRDGRTHGGGQGIVGDQHVDLARRAELARVDGAKFAAVGDHHIGCLLYTSDAADEVT